MNGVTRRVWCVGAILILAMVAYGAKTMLDAQTAMGSVPEDKPPTPDLLAAAPSPSATTRPTRTPPTPTATPLPSPTVGYLNIMPTPAPHKGVAPTTRGAVREWRPEERALVIDQARQEIYIYENGQKIRTIPCSTGKPLLDHFTPSWVGRVGPFYGTFYSFGVYADHAWQLFKASGDILIHGAPYVYINGEKVYQDLDSLGNYPSSHGCIRIAPEDAEWLTTWNPYGVPVIVTPWQGGFTE